MTIVIAFNFSESKLPFNDFSFRTYRLKLKQYYTLSLYDLYVTLIFFNSIMLDFLLSVNVGYAIGSNRETRRRRAPSSFTMLASRILTLLPDLNRA